MFLYIDISNTAWKWIAHQGQKIPAHCQRNKMGKLNRILFALISFTRSPNNSKYNIARVNWNDISVATFPDRLYIFSRWHCGTNCFVPTPFIACPLQLKMEVSLCFCKCAHVPNTDNKVLKKAPFLSTTTSMLDNQNCLWQSVSHSASFRIIFSLWILVSKIVVPSCPLQHSKIW